MTFAGSRIKKSILCVVLITQASPYNGMRNSASTRRHADCNGQGQARAAVGTRTATTCNGYHTTTATRAMKVFNGINSETTGQCDNRGNLDLEG